MPAIKLVQLKSEISHLSQKFGSPDEYHRELLNFFERYSNHVYRPGEMVRPPRQTPVYYINSLIMLTLENELVQLCNQNPNAALQLADLLWNDPFLETRLLSGFLLGQIPPALAGKVIAFIHAHTLSQEDPRVLDNLFNIGTSRLRVELPDQWLSLIESWHDQPQSTSQEIMLRALKSLALDRKFENLPFVFKLLATPLQTCPQNIQILLVDVLTILAERTPIETAFFIRQVLSSSSITPRTIRIVRKIIPVFPDEVQKGIRQMLASISAA